MAKSSFVATMKTLSKLLFCIAMMSLFSSCYTYKVFPKEYKNLSNNEPKQVAFITNPSASLWKEISILQSSDLFVFSKDSTAAEIKIKVYPVIKSKVCGQGMVLSMVTIGQLPMLFPDRYVFSFDEIKNHVTLKRKYDLKLSQRVWFWDMFVFNKNFKKKAGKALLGEYKNIK